MIPDNIVNTFHLITGAIAPLSTYAALPVPATWGGAAIALLAGPLGCLLMWKRVAFLGDALAHMGLLGVAVALWMHTAYAGIAFVFSGLFAAVYTGLSRHKEQPNDALLAWLTQTALAMSMVLFSLYGPEFDPETYLFGEWGDWTLQDMVLMLGVLVVFYGVLWRYFPQILVFLIDRDAYMLHYPASLSPGWMHVLLLWGAALLVAFALKMVGGLLCAGLLVIPPLAARWWANTPLQMMAYATLIAVFSTMGGGQWAVATGNSAGPVIVLAANVFFIGGYAVSYGLSLRARKH